MRRRGRSDGVVPVTIGKVAAAAAVSTATASRALNRPNTVSEVRRNRVLAAVAQLGYVPNQSARALSSLHSGLVGVLVPAFDTSDARVLGTLQARLHAAGYATLIEAIGIDGDRALDAARDLAARDVDGLLVVGTGPGQALTAFLSERRIPCVLVDAGGGTTTQASIDIDYAAAGETVGAYLSGLGHRSLAFLGHSTNGRWRGTALLQGLRASLAASGATLSAERVLACPAFEIRTALLRWLGDAVRPTALVCADDLLALAALQESALIGIAMPDQLSIIGCGDLPFARHASPPLSTLRIPAAIVGNAAVEQLLERLAGGPPTRRSIPIKLVIRRSSGPARP